MTTANNEPLTVTFPAAAELDTEGGHKDVITSLWYAPERREVVVCQDAGQLSIRRGWDLVIDYRQDVVGEVVLAWLEEKFDGLDLDNVEEHFEHIHALPEEAYCWPCVDWMAVSTDTYSQVVDNLGLPEDAPIETVAQALASLTYSDHKIRLTKVEEHLEAMRDEEQSA